MHTSHTLTASDFRYQRRCDDGWLDVTFDAFCPAWHPQDRIAVVAPLHDLAVITTLDTCLALATRYYDHLRATKGDFFDYPQHFAFMGGDATTLHTLHGEVAADVGAAGASWSQLDVWPQHKWFRAEPTAGAMLTLVFDLQIDRILWPGRFFSPADASPMLPEYAKRMLRTHLKQVWLYDVDESDATLRITSTSAIDPVAAASLRALPGYTDSQMAELLALREARHGESSHAASFAELPVDDFLCRVGAAFAG